MKAKNEKDFLAAKLRRKEHYEKTMDERIAAVTQHKHEAYLRKSACNERSVISSMTFKGDDLFYDTKNSGDSDEEILLLSPLRQRQHECNFSPPKNASPGDEDKMLIDYDRYNDKSKYLNIQILYRIPFTFTLL